MEVLGKLTEENIHVLRPGEKKPGLHPKFYNEIIGTTATRTIDRWEGITWKDVNQN